MSTNPEIESFSATIDWSKYVVNEPAGDYNSGDHFLIMPKDDKLFLTTFQTWSGNVAGDHWALSGIRVWYSDQTESAKGHTSGTAMQTISMEEGEKVTDFKLSGGDKVDHITFSTDKDRKLDAGGSGGNKQTINIGNGTLVGFKGSAADENVLYSLGPIFRK